MSGWLKLHRQLQDNPLWLAEPFTRGQAWVDLLMIANHTPGRLYLRGNRIDVDRGVAAWSKIKLAERWKWSRGKVLRFLSELENDGQVVQQTVHNLTLITLCNYDEYQKRSDDAGTSDSTTDDTTGSTTDGQQTVHIKEEQKQQEEKEILRLRENEIPKSGRQWCDVFITGYGYQIAEVQTSKTIPMFNRWSEQGVSVKIVIAAMDIATARLGNVPNTPVYLDGVVRDLMNPAKPLPANGYRAPSAKETPTEKGERLAAERMARENNYPEVISEQ